MKRLLKSLIALVTLAGVMPCGAAEFTVGPEKAHARIETALAAAKPGDTVLVYPQPDGKPYAQVALLVAKPKIALRGMAGEGKRIKLDGSGFDYSGRGKVPRAIVQFDRGADGGVLDGFELSGARNASFNGAGVRINQANDITIRNCVIHGNDMGIMSNGDGTLEAGANQLIEGCLIHANGTDKQPGYNHNLYLGGASVTLRACEVHSSLTGHNVKSRAHVTRVLWSFVHDSANREFDLVDSKGCTDTPESHALLAGNVIIKDPKCAGNRGVIHFGQDGGGEHDGTLWMVHNTVVTPFVTPVVMLSAGKARARLIGNIFSDRGNSTGRQRLTELTKTLGQAKVFSGDANWASAGFAPASAGLEGTVFGKAEGALPFLNLAKGDVRLFRPEPTIAGMGKPLPPEVLEMMGKSLKEYHAPLSAEERADAKNLDLGAFGPVRKKPTTRPD